ncbi:MAG: TrbI/VirB10 family protein [Alphaproteobacteria bacterium]|nr:TrbI/VirB10 family protein [Alphaproteobacteria bacterium]
MVNNRESLSEQSKRRTNYLLFGVGSVLLLFFLLAWCSMQPEEKTERPRENPDVFNLYREGGDPGKDADMPVFASQGDAQLIITPREVVMDKVIIGSEVAHSVVLRAENAPLLLKKKELAEKDQKEGFDLGGSCMSLDRLEKNEECLLKVSWHPTELRNIQNTLTITWIEDSRSVFKEERSVIILKGQSTDSKDCVICEDIRKEAEQIPEKKLGTNGKEENLNGDEKKTADCLIKDDDDKIIGICRGELIPLSLKNELLGKVDDSHNVIDANGQKIGRLLGDDTIVNSKFEVIGKAIPSVLTAMKGNGRVFGKISVDNNGVSIIDANGKILGFPNIDGQVVDKDGQPIGFLSPWGGVIDSMGNFLGVTMPDGSVLNDKNERVAYMRPMGLAVDSKGILVGGIVPRGIGVGIGRSLGEVSLNGDVKDSFGQVVGRVLLDHSVVDAQMNDLGRVVRQGVIIDTNGQVIGFVNSIGEAVNFEGKIIGHVRPDGTVFAGKRFVGSVMKEGRVIKDGCQQIGSVYPDGSVVNLALTKLGNVTSEGIALDTRHQKLGFISPWGTAIASGCHLLGLLSLDGDVVSVDGMRTGCVNSDLSVQNLQGEISGQVTRLGLFVDNQNQVIGRVRLDGQIMDNKGTIIGCSYEAKKHPGVLVSDEAQGVIVDENGLPLEGTFIGNKAYDERGNWLGNVYFNGWVIGDKGKLIGRVPFSGLVFDDKGQILGSYNQKTGTLVDTSGDRLGRVLPGLSVISLDGKAILGKLIPFGTPFVAMDGTFLGNLRSDGLVVDGAKSVDGTLLANGSIIGKDKKLLGGMISAGPVIASDGKYVGLSVGNGEVVNAQNVKIGRMLSNGLAISDANQVLGHVFPELSIAVSARGFIGFLEPNIQGSQDNPSYQLQVKDTKGNMAGTVSSTGVVLGLNNTVLGNLVPVAPFVDGKGKLIGWSNFEGGVNNLDGRSIGTVLPSGAALDSSQDLFASVVNNAVAVDNFGAYLGHFNSRGEVLSDRGELIARIGQGGFLSNADGMLIGQVLKPGVAVDNSGRFMGWTRYDGQIENGVQVVGQVGLDGHVFDAAGQMVGRYLPLGTPAFNDDEKSVGFLSDNAEVMDAAGLKLTKMGYEPFVMNKGNLVARFIEGDNFVTSLEQGEVIGMTTNDGSVIPLTSDRSVGSLKMNRQFLSSRQIKGALVPMGVPVTPTLGVIGSAELNGEIFKAGKRSGIITGMGLVYSPSGELVGSVLTPGVIIDSKGAFVGRSSGTSAVFSGNQQIGNQLTFGAVLSTSNEWLGHSMKTGAVVNAHGVYQGIIGSNGLAVGPNGVFVGRVLPDGSVASVSDSSVFNTMPYIGHTVEQGIAIEYSEKNTSLGHTTANGDVLDWGGKKIARISDNALALARKEDKTLPSAHIFPLISAIDVKGNVMGTVTSDGRVISYKGKVLGKLDNGGRIRYLEPKDKEESLKILGTIVPDGLVVNDCKIVGQTAYDGRVINGQGVVVGRINTDKWAIDVNGNKIGRVAKNNQPCITEDGKYLGRSLPNSIVVDVNGVPVGCATNSGEMLDSKGNLLCKIVERGPIVDGNGDIIGYQDDKNWVWDGGKEPIGTVDWDNKAWDNNGNQIGIGIGDRTLLDGGNTQGGDGWIYNKEGEPVIWINPDTGNAENPDGVAGLHNYVLGRGYFEGCDFMGLDGRKVATLMADGTMRDENGDLYATVTPNGDMYEPNGNLIDHIRGLDVSTQLKQCGMSGAGKGANRIVKIGDQPFFVDPKGSVYNEDNEIIGWMGDDGKLYTFNNKPITGDVGGRKPPEPQTVDIPKEKLEDFQSRLAEKRKSMREKFGKGTLLIPSPELQARAKPKKDTDWSKLGVSKDSVSSWPVDMTHVILEGKAIPAVLARSIDSRYPDSSALAIVEKNVYGEEGRNILIPAGSRLIGQASTGLNAAGVAKIQINWKRLIRPDGSAFNLDDSPSGDAQGRGGVAAYLDAQLWNKYATPVLSTLATSAVAYMMATNDDVTTSSGGSNGQQQTMSQKAQAAADARKNFIDMIQIILEKMIEEANEEPPVIYVPAGTRLVVFPKKDLWLRSVTDDEKDAEKEFGPPSTEAQVPDMDSWAEKRKSEREEQGASENTDGASEQVPPDTVAPIYNGQEDMPDLSDRKVMPVTQEDKNMF